MLFVIASSYLLKNPSTVWSSIKYSLLSYPGANYNTDGQPTAVFTSPDQYSAEYSVAWLSASDSSSASRTVRIRLEIDMIVALDCEESPTALCPDSPKFIMFQGVHCSVKHTCPPTQLIYTAYGMIAYFSRRCRRAVPRKLHIESRLQRAPGGGTPQRDFRQR